MLPRLCSCCVLALLLGCVATGPPAGPQFDGVYQGASRLVGGGGPLCGTPDEQLALTVRNGQFDYPFLVNAPRTAPLNVQIAADGSFRGDMQFGFVEPWAFGTGYRTEWATVSGHIVASTMQGTIETLECTRQMSMQRR